MDQSNTAQANSKLKDQTAKEAKLASDKEQMESDGKVAETKKSTVSTKRK